MDIQRKHELLAQAKSNRVSNIPIVESETEPNTTHCIWLKQGIMYAFENGVWEALSSGSSGDDPRLVPPTSYPFEVPYNATQSNVTEYQDKEGLLDFTYIPEDLVYVIGKSGNYYTLIGTLDTRIRTVRGELFPTTDRYEFHGNIFGSQSTKVGDCSKRDDSNFSVAITNSFPQYDSVIFDTEYNTDKYPEVGPQIDPGPAY